MTNTWYVTMSHPQTLRRGRIRGFIFTLIFHLTHLSSPQLEDLEVTVADHIQKVLKPNFGAAWEEVGDEFEKEETFALASVRTLEGVNQKIEAEVMSARRFAESVRRFDLCRH